MRRDCNGKFPRNWNSYLQNVSNNLDMCYYLPVFIAQIVFCEGKVVISTLAENILGSLVPDADESEYPLRPCTIACSECSVARLQAHTYYCERHWHNRTGDIVLQWYWRWQTVAYIMELETDCRTLQFMTALSFIWWISLKHFLHMTSLSSLFSVSRTLTDVNQTHRQIFAQSSRILEYLPPTKSALVEPIKNIPTGYVWSQSIIASVA